MRWDIFCTVIDNYGDAGVCWRLARQLAHEHGLDVRLCIDDLACLAKMLPGVDPRAANQKLEGVTLWHWAPGTAPDTVGDVVLDAFACRLPPAYLARMAAQARAPVWINVDYLSAESWVEGCHGLASRHPPLTEFFFYPGFTPATGGLLREATLIAQRDAFQRDAAAQARLWTKLGVTPPAPDCLRISLFTYENAALPGLLDAWTTHSRPVWCGVPEGRVWTTLSNWLGARPLDGRAQTVGALTVVPLPFVDQATYDRLLWACDLNFVRGEDSFVRAQWAGAPFVWHIYPQEDNAHALKLDAFLARYTQALATAPADALIGFHQRWNALHPAAPGDAWRALAEHLPDIAHHAQAWCAQLSAQDGLASALVTFARNKL